MPEPVLISIATAVATKASLDLYGLVKRRFERQPEDLAVLDAATADSQNHERIEALAERIETAEQQDAAFGQAVRADWNSFTVGDNSVVNQVTGTVHGTVTQLGDVHGNINLNL